MSTARLMRSRIVTQSAYYKNVLLLALPIMLQQLLRVSVDTLDSIMLGRVDQIQMAAVSQAQQIFFIFYTLCSGFSVGCCVLIAQYWGKQEFERIKTLISIGVRYIAMFSIAVSACLLLWPELAMRVYSSDPELIRHGADFLRISVWMYMPCAVSCMLFASCRGIEEMRVSFTTNAISYPLNILLDYCLIFGKLGLPALGIRGAAIGAVIARLVELLILGSFVFYREKKLQMRLSDLKRWDRKLSGQFFKVGVPIVAHEFIWSTGTTAGSSITGQMGTTVVAGYSVAFTMYQLIACIMNGVNHACSVTIGKAIGSGRSREALQQEAYTMLLIGLVGGAAMGVLTLLTGNLFISLYVISEDSVAYARLFVIIFAAIWPFSGVEMTGLIATCRAGGDGKTGFICDIFSMWLITIPLASIAAFWLHLSPVIVIAIIKINIAIEAMVGVFRIRSMKWVHNLTQA